MNDKVIKIKRSEEVEDIIGNISNKGAKWTLMIVLFLAMMLLLFCYVIKYPMVVSGEIKIVTENETARNALDAINEAKIVNALNNAFESRTVVVVAHRLSTIQNAHQIVVLNDGVITEIGNHNVLMSHKGDYYKLVMNQMSGSLN